jgi:hypothetical protein
MTGAPIDRSAPATARRAVRELSNAQLAARLETLNDKRRIPNTRLTEAMWSPVMKKAFLEEASRRLRWVDAYTKGAVEAEALRVSVSAFLDQATRGM